MKMISWMLNKVDTPAGRKGRLSGEKHWKVEQKDLNAVGGRSAFVAQAEALEAEGLIRVKWYDVDHTDAEIVHFRLENLSELYRRAGKRRPGKKLLFCGMRWKNGGEAGKRAGLPPGKIT